MKSIRKVPYGQANYETIIRDDFVYVDKTKYIETLESLSERFLFFLRPRRFGKSLFISTLQYYYGKEHKEKFQALFGNTYIGKNPTPYANGYAVLLFDFSKIAAGSDAASFASFNGSVEDSLYTCYKTYSLLSEAEWNSVLSAEQPGDRLSRFFTFVKINHPGLKIYILIDEYDHFANDIIEFKFEQFVKNIARNGHVGKFYEAVNVAARDGIVERMFVTGVTPITLDALAGGFSIGGNITFKPKFNDLMGFTEDEVRFVLREACEDGKYNEAELIKKLSEFYNGYLFSTKAATRLSNPAAVLYFVSNFVLNDYTFPRIMLDKSVTLDYPKIRKMTAIKNQKQCREALQKIIADGEIDSDITEQYNFELGFSETDFISLLFYNGMLTIKEAEFARYRLKIPNYVIREVYWSFFINMLEERT